MSDDPFEDDTSEEDPFADYPEPRPRIARLGPGRFALEIPKPERRLLRNLLPDLGYLVETRDPDTKRLFPAAYHDDPEKEAEYQRLMAGDLAAGRLAAIETVEKTIDEPEIDLPALERWMEAINSLRLVLGTRLEVGEDLPMLEVDDPDAPAYAVYEYLGWLMEQAVRAMSEDLAQF
ncbi:MAG TPA: DUF2017 family protein [Actinomycetota bacterium]|nr:DUF2017 family protein [Actinomycetota bacterium]